jgi:hypothetical protein
MRSWQLRPSCQPTVNVELVVLEGPLRRTGTICCGKHGAHAGRRNDYVAGSRVFRLTPSCSAYRSWRSKRSVWQGTRTPSQAEQRFSYHDELAKRVVNDSVRMETPTEGLKQKPQEIQREIYWLCDQVADEAADRVAADEGIAAAVRPLPGEPLSGLTRCRPTNKRGSTRSCSAGSASTARGVAQADNGDSPNARQPSATGR